MSRANRVFYSGQVWHITHRCHRSEFLLRFIRDRRRWRHWLFVAQRRYGLCILDYIATSNHVHILVVDRGMGEISASMQLVAGRTAQEFNSRKNRRGAFWEDRYHATAVQSDSHLIRCLSYIDLNMVRAGAVVHPRDWEISGYNEIQSPWIRKGVVDFSALRRFAGVNTNDELAQLLSARVDNEISETNRDPIWTESVAVGDDAYVIQAKERLGGRGMSKRAVRNGEVWMLRDGDLF